jgi:hypothetical protein
VFSGDEPVLEEGDYMKWIVALGMSLAVGILSYAMLAAQGQPDHVGSLTISDGSKTTDRTITGCRQ